MNPQRIQDSVQNSGRVQLSRATRHAEKIMGNCNGNRIQAAADELRADGGASAMPPSNAIWMLAG